MVERAVELVRGRLERYRGTRLHATAAALRERLVWFWRTTVEVYLRADGDHIFMLAAGIAFNFIIALVPTILVVFMGLGYFLDADQIIRQLNELATTYNVAPGYRDDLLQTIRQQIDALVANRGLAGAIGIGGVLWSASALATSIRVAINKVMRCRETRNYFFYKMYDILAVMMIGLLVFISIVTGPLLGIVLAASDRVAGALDLSLTGFEWAIGEGVNVVTTLALFYVIFRYVPYQRQRRVIIWVGTLTSTLLWLLARYIFRFYVTEFGTLTRVYGVYAFFAASALWLYFSALVFLIGAEIAYHVKQSRWNARRLFDRLSRRATSEA